METMIRAERQQGCLRVVDDQTMSSTATVDVARVVIRILTHRCPPGSITWSTPARPPGSNLRGRSFGAPAWRPPSLLRHGGVRGARRARYSVLDDAKVTAALGAMPAWQDALERYLRAKGHAKSRELDRRRVPGIPTRRRGALRRRQQ